MKQMIVYKVVRGMSSMILRQLFTGAFKALHPIQTSNQGN